MNQSFAVDRAGGVALAGQRTGPAGAPAVVLLHAGVADRRSWHAVQRLLQGDGVDLIAYDRRGFGDTPVGEQPFSHLDDLAATMPERVASLLLIGAAVSGMTDEDTPFDWAADPATRQLLDASERARASGDVEAEVRALLHLWLDGPDQPEGRVGGEARALAAEMNRRILEVAAPDDAGDPGLEVWGGLGEVAVPVLATWGEHDIPADLPFYAETARRLPHAEQRALPGTAHLPSLDRPELVAALIREAVALAH